MFGIIWNPTHEDGEWGMAHDIAIPTLRYIPYGSHTWLAAKSPNRMEVVVGNH